MDARSLFPGLDRQVYGKPLIYFDNAATAQRPQAVLDLQQRLCVEACDRLTILLFFYPS